MRGVLALARSWAADIEGGVVKNAAALARRESVSATRVGEVLRLLDLTPAILRALEDAEAKGSIPAEADLRDLARTTQAGDQLAAFTKLCAEARRPGRPRKTCPVSDETPAISPSPVPAAPRAKPRKCRGRPPSRTPAGWFDEARRYETLLRSGRYRSLAEIARAEGIERTFIANVHRLLYLPAEVIATIESAEEPLVGVTMTALHRIAGMKGEQVQREAFQALLRKE